LARDYELGVYYFPNYHVDKRNEEVHGPGWTEWELMKRAEPRFPGHQQPRVPLWGYEDEADPRIMEKKIEAAADHGVDYFIFDWYHYDDGPFLNRCLDEGYLGAANNSRVRFCLMWANHDWTNLHPAKADIPAEYWRKNRAYLLYPGQVTREAFEEFTDDAIRRYFLHPSYWTVDGCPYFSVYDLTKLLASFGGVAETREALDHFRDRARKAGLPGLHLNAVVWGSAILPGESAATDPAKLIVDLGFDSFTSYVWIHHVAMNDFPLTDYNWMRDRYMEYWNKAEREFDLPYYPNVTMGWDSSPRTVQSDVYRNIGYPFTPILSGNTPEAFGKALEMTRARLDSRSGPKILNINAWNEWTEGSYLEPDTVNGMGYLEAIKRAFG
jgi:hypothetical protein